MKEDGNVQVWLEGKELHGAFDPVRTSVGQSGSI
jgi:hypothetical protein